MYAMYHRNKNTLASRLYAKVGYGEYVQLGPNCAYPSAVPSTFYVFHGLSRRDCFIGQTITRIKDSIE
jgi:hypothetical protein